MKYIRYQEDFYFNSFSPEALRDSTDLRTFLDLIPQHTPEDVMMIKLIRFKRQAKLSRQSANALLELIAAFHPTVKVPKDWGSVTRYMDKKTDYLRKNSLAKEVAYPAQWNIGDWSEINPPPPVRVNHTRDVYQMLAYKMVCPVMMYIFKNDIRLDAERLEMHDGTRCCTDLMTSDYMIATQDDIRSREGHEDTICVPLIVYADGVALGVRNKVKATTVMCSFGIYSDALLQRDVSKVSLGYINDLSDHSKDLLVKHLCTHGNYSKSGAMESIRAFGRKIERDYWLLLFETLIKYEDTGVRMNVLGRGECKVKLVLAFMVGDDPAIHRYCCLYEGNAMRTCVRCLYKRKRDGVYIPHNVVLRDHNINEDRARVAEQAEMLKSSGIALNILQRHVLNIFKLQCTHSLLNPTASVPMGYTKPLTPNHIYNSPPDLLHTWCCGIMKNVLLWTVSVIMLVSKSRGYELNRGLFDSRVAAFSHLPKMPNVTTTYFKAGITCISKNKTSAQQLATSGGAAGYRSCEFVPALLFTYVAVS
jgi:hypothetical protein